MRTLKHLAAFLAVITVSITSSFSQALRIQNFDSEASAQADGWFEKNSRTEGRNNFGFTNITSFPDTTAGEAGGYFARTTNTCFYGTTNLGTIFTLTNLMHAEGRLKIEDFGSLADSVIAFAFFDIGQLGQSSARSTAGFTVQEPQAAVDTQALRCKPSITLANGVRRDPPIDPAPNNTQSKTATYTKRGLYRWSFDIVPQSDGRAIMTMSMWTNGASVTLRNPMTVTISAADVATNSPVFNAFGIYLTGSGAGEYQSNNNTNNFITLFVDNFKFTDSQSLPCIQASPSGLIVSAGQTNRTVTVTIPAQLNLSQTVGISVTSQDPSIATPTGSPSGVTNLVFSAGATNSQSFDITGLATGSTVFVIVNTNGVCVSESISVTVPAASQSTIAKTQPFDTGSSAAAGGWVEFLSRINGDSFGFTNSNFAGGTAAGEAGGTFSVVTNVSYYADVFTPALTLNDTISASGKFVLNASPTVNNDIRVGHFFSTGLENANMIGFSLAEPAETGGARLRAVMQYANGSGQLSGVLFSPSPGQVYNWNYTYNPANNGQLTLNFDDGSGGTASATINVNYPLRTTGASFDSFGIKHTAFGTNNTDTAEVYIDDVTYTALAAPIRFVKIENLGSTIRLTFTTPQPGGTHQVQSSSVLPATSWSPVSGVTFGTTGSQLTAEFAKPSTATSFYRIVLP